MLKKFKDDFNNANSLEKFNSLSSIFTISGVSLLTIFNALDGVNFIQIAVACFVFGFIAILVSLLLGVYMFIINSLKDNLNSMILVVLIIGMVLLFLGFLFYSIFSGIDLINSFNSY